MVLKEKKTYSKNFINIENGVTSSWTHSPYSIDKPLLRLGSKLDIERM